MLPWLGKRPHGKAWFGLDRLKQLQVQEKVGWTTQKYKNPSTKPCFSWSVHSTFLISCYLKSHTYIFFDSINLTRFCSDCKYFMLSLFYYVRMQSSIWMISSPLLHLLYEWYQSLWIPFLEILEIFISVNWLSIINPSLFISNLIHSLHFISHLNFIFIEMLLQTSIEKKSLIEQVKRVCDTI